MTKKKSTAEFREDARRVYPDSPYSYDASVYVDARTKLTVTCKLHGDFMVSPNNHLTGTGCPACGRERTSAARRSSTDEFIRKAKLVHGEDTFNYARVRYRTAQQKITVICRTHGEFKQYPGNHLKGHGCLKCGWESTAAKQRSSTSEFIAKSKKRHGSARYDYSAVEYSGDKNKVELTCNVHRTRFLMTPGDHLQGRGCPKCGRERSEAAKWSSLDEFISRAQIVHGVVRYDYSRAVYKGYSDKIEIFCKKHKGSFYQTPANHLGGNGCHVCKESIGERTIRLLLENSGISFEGQKKFASCRDTLKLPFDFYIPNGNLLVEFDGEQHFKAIDHFGGEEKFISRQRRDAIKTKWAADNGYTLVRIPYTDQDRIPEILNSILVEASV